jgi:hypothetical protein
MPFRLYQEKPCFGAVCFGVITCDILFGSAKKLLTVLEKHVILHYV